VLDDGDSETLTVNAQVDDDQAGNSITYTAMLSSSLPSDDPVPGDNTDSVVLSVLDVSDPGGESGSGPYLSVFPIYTDLWRYDFNVFMKTIRNRKTTNNIQKNLEEQSLREISLRRITVAPSTTETVNIGGIERARNLMLDADSAVQLSVSLGDTSDLFGPETTFVFIGGGDFAVVKVKNNSATATATVTIGVTD
jgi:hypothetical protein